MEAARESYEFAKEAIRAAGLRATPARIATLEVLRESAAPLTHAEVAQKLSHLQFDLATVFRALNGLAEVKLVRRAELGDHAWRFEASHDESGAVAAHPHFLCVDCGSVKCLQRVELTASSLLETARVGEVTEVLVRGRCNDCR